MHVDFEILEPAAETLGWTYGDMKYANYGVGAFRYSGGYMGPPQWINWRKQRFDSPIGGWNAFVYWVRPGVVARCHIVPDIRSKAPDLILDQLKINLTKGLNVLVPPG